MAPITLVTGGARSGKSRYAEEQLRDSPRVIYIATARCLDGEMERRIQLHRQRRPVHWITVEATRDLDRVLEDYPAGDVFLDCVGNMVTNLMLEGEPDYDKLPMDRIEEIEARLVQEMDKLTAALRRQERRAVLVTNEVGMSVVSPYRMGRVFTDILGRVNQRLAAQADEVILMACGLPMRLK